MDGPDDAALGSYLPDEIDRGLAASDVIVGIMSPDAADSRDVKNEWEWGIQNSKPLVFLRVRPTVVPHRYVSKSRIDATGADPSPALEAL